jgi:hypothetical protein
MKEYLFVVHYVKDGRGATEKHTENFSCDADAMVRGREILKEAKRDINAYMVSVHRLERIHVVSYI